MKIVAVIPAFRAGETVKHVAVEALQFCNLVIVVDDKCPENSGQSVEGIHSNIKVVYRNENGGVGAATKTGIKKALQLEADVIVKLDADGQMDSSRIPELVEPLVDKLADMCKGTRFDSPEDFEGMPLIRLIGNSFLSLVSKFTSGYWTVNDPTNGFIAFTRKFAKEIYWDKVSDGYFFESDLLFRARLISARISQVRMRAIYQGETSSLRPFKQVFPFAWKHLRNQVKRILYMYFIREWNLGTVYLISSALPMVVGIAAGLSTLSQASSGAVGTGTAVLSSLGLILWVQLLTQFLTFDVTTEPK